MSIVLALVTSVLISSVRGDCNDGWSTCDSSIWVSPKFIDENPDVLESYTPGEIRGPLEYEIKFSCRGRRAGYYADLDHSCKVWHYCNTTRELNPINGLSTWTYMHFSYACTEEGTRYDQVLKECIPESRALVGCRESELYYPTGEFVHDVPITIQSNNRLVPVRCPQSPVRCQVQKDHIKLSLCPEAPGAVSKFYSAITSETDVSSPVPSLAYGTRELTSSSASDSDEGEEGGLDEEAPAPDAPSSTAAPPAPTEAAPAAPSHSVPLAAPAILSNPGKVSDSSKTSGKTNTFRFRQTPAAAARKAPQGKVQPNDWFAPARKTVIPAPQTARKFVVTDLASQPFEQSKTSHTFSRKTSFSRKTVSSPAVSQVKTRFYSEEGKEEQTFPFIASHQVIFPRRLTEQMEVPILQIRDASPSATPAPTNESEAAGFLGLPIGSTRILGFKIDTSFDCTGRTYGYYADVKNQCKIYHVCSPKVDEFGTKFYEHYSFVCSEGLVFDQQKLTCLPEKEASTPCEESEKFFTRTATIFKEGNESWLLKKQTSTTEAPQTTTGRPIGSVEPVYVDTIPDEPLIATSRKSLSQQGKAFAGGYEHSIASPSRILKGKTSYHQESQQQESASQESLSQDSQLPQSQYPADNSENGQGHRPSITQTIVRAGGQRVFHNPRISQKIQSPESPADSQEILHNPSIDQYVAQPSGQPTSFRSISHNPSISQYVSQPDAPSDHKIISHNPSISQYIPAPAAPASSDQVISHNPSITQYVAGPGVQVPPDQRISHNPTISQYVPQAVPGSNSQSISHNPSINQVITLPEYSRPSSRVN